jgi:hypothetical protein
MTKHHITITRIAIATALAAGASLAQAALSASVYDAAKEQIQGNYKAEREACNSLSGNAKDICVETAKGAEKVALAHLQWQRSGSPQDATKLAEARYAARYEVAKEKCDDLSGNAKSLCVTAAKTEHDKAKADVKMNRLVGEARSDAEDAKLKADYKLAAERCDGLAGDAKDTCVASVKARFGM